jgi:hypothetical protein
MVKFRVCIEAFGLVLEALEDEKQKLEGSKAPEKSGTKPSASREAFTLSIMVEARCLMYAETDACIFKDFSL